MRACLSQLDVGVLGELRPLAISPASSLWNSSGVLADRDRADVDMRCWIAGSRTMAANTVAKRWTISGGVPWVPAAVPRFARVARHPGLRDRRTSGDCGARVLVVMPSARTVPPAIWGSASE